MITRGDLAYPGFVMTEIETIFRDTFYGQAALQQADRISTLVKSTSPIVKYPFIGSGPRMKLFRDRMDDQAGDPQLVTIEDAEFYANMRISAKALEDDGSGLYRLQADQMGRDAAGFPDEYVFTALDAAFTGVGGANNYKFGLGYDNQPILSANHQTGNSGVQSNLTNVPLSATALQNAIGISGSWLDDTGRPYGTNLKTLVVGRQLEMRARELVESPVVVVRVGDGTVATGATTATDYKNVLQGRFEVVVSPWITGFHWFLLDTDRAVKPIIMQDRQDVPMKTWNDLNDPRANRDREFNFSVFRRTGFGYGPWQLFYGSNATS